MPYLGNAIQIGDHTGNFKVLDDIKTHTATFDGSASSVVSTSDNTIRIAEHRFLQGQRVTYNNGGGGNIGGLTSGTAYFIIFDSNETFKLATSASNATALTAINLSAVGSGSSHTLNVAFDGTNTKFKATTGLGNPIKIAGPVQLNIAINNVLQKPNRSGDSLTEGFKIEDNHKIVFATAPSADEVFWGSLIAKTVETFDISDNKIDSFTGDGSTTEFNLSKVPPNSNALLITLDGVTQHPTDASGTKSYSVDGNNLEFTSAPASGVEIQVRHIGFAGASTGGVTGFYGRTGNVQLTSTDNIVANNATFAGDVSIGGTLTYEDVKNVDAVGIITAQSDIHVGAGVSAVGVGTFGGVDINGDIDVDGHTNLDNVNVAGVTTFAGTIDANGVIEGVAGQNKIPSLYNALTDLPNAGTYHGMFAHVHATGRGYFAHGGGWYELVNKELSGVVGTGTESYNVGNVKVGSGVTIESNGQATFTGIVTFGSSSTTIDGDANTVKVGTALTLGHTQGVQFHTQNLHSQGFEVNQINATGIITATSLSSSGDTNTKINFPAADTITAETGGDERLRIDSNGKLLGGNYFTSKQIGAVTAPVQIQGTTADTSALSLFRYSNDTGGSTITLGKGRGTSGGAIDKPQEDDTVGTIHFHIANNNDLVNGNVAAIDVQVDAEPGGADTPGRIRFLTSPDGSSTLAERLRIASNGAIGLGGANYGSSGQVLTSQGSSSAPTWATPSGGKILQTVNATATSQVERTSSGFADTGLTANITLSAANKVLIFVAQSLEARQYNATGFAVGRLKLVRITSGTYYNVFGPGGRSIVTSGPGSGSYFIASGCIASIVAEDSPGVGTHTYATQIARTVGGGGTAVRANSDGHPAEIILMEVES